MGSAIVVADTSVIINFLRIDRMDLIGAHPSPFIVTDHVADEIADSYPEQQARFHAALGVGHITQHRIDDPTEVEIFLRLSTRGRLGAGERSAIAVALNRGCALAIDDSRAIRRAIEEAGIAGNPLTVLRTQDVMVQLIRAGIISVDTADVILLDWATNHRFRLKVSSFAEIL
jgi:predicted nucleic acid-binding protein